MKHPLVRLLVVTGGPAVVKEAMNSGKRAIAPGRAIRRPSSTRPRTSTRPRRHRARRVARQQHRLHRREGSASRSTGSRTSCSAELKRQPVLLLDHRQVSELEKVVLEGDHVNKDWVGKNAGVIAKRSGSAATATICGC